MKNYVENGCSIEITAAADLISGQAVKVGAVIGVCVANIATGQTGTVALDGVYSIPKAVGAISQGAIVYWDDAAKNITTTSTSNTPCGFAFASALSADASVSVSLKAMK